MFQRFRDTSLGHFWSGLARPDPLGTLGDTGSLGYHISWTAETVESVVPPLSVSETYVNKRLLLAGGIEGAYSRLRASFNLKQCSVLAKNCILT